MKKKPGDIPMISGAILSQGAHPCVSGTMLNVIMYWLLLGFSTNPSRALPINEESIPLSVQTYFSFSWLLTDDGVEHRNVLKSIYQLLPPDLSYHQ